MGNDKKNKSVMESLAILEAKVDLVLELLSIKNRNNRINEMVREISGEIEVLEPHGVYVRPRKSIGGCSSDCICRNRKNGTDPLPYA